MNIIFNLPVSYLPYYTVAPIKALCSERYADWSDKFGPLGLTCCELTGDTEMDDYFELHRAHIIATTPVGLTTSCIPYTPCAFNLSCNFVQPIEQIRRVIFSLISLVVIVVSHFCKLQKKAH